MKFYIFFSVVTLLVNYKTILDHKLLVFLKEGNLELVSKSQKTFLDKQNVSKETNERIPKSVTMTLLPCIPLRV